MTVRVDDDAIARVAAMPAVREAARTGARLIALWPLTDAKQMDNDAKYAENLQVRLTRMIARVVTGEDVTVPDAEFVYEGADEIPGRPQAIVDALLAANDAYDMMAGYRDDGDARVLFDVADQLGAGWNDGVVAAVTDALGSVDALAAREGAAAGDAGEPDAGAAVEGDDEPSAEAVAELADRFAGALAVCDGLFSAIDEALDGSGKAGAEAVAMLPVLLFVNELRERLAVPRICLKDGEYYDLLRARAAAEDTLEATVTVIAPLAAAEWQKHYDDVTWDPDEAKRLAKEEDERKNKEALAAKFAHIKDDPGKETVEL